MSELAKKYKLYPNQLSKWKQEFVDNLPKIFDTGESSKENGTVDVECLYSEIGKLKMECNYLKKA